MLKSVLKSVIGLVASPVHVSLSYATAYSNRNNIKHPFNVSLFHLIVVAEYSVLYHPKLKRVALRRLQPSALSQPNFPSQYFKVAENLETVLELFAF